MSSRPAIPTHVQQEVLFEARHHCAVCCYPTALERAHIVPWRETKDHSLANLICLCANCHTRYDNEKWPESDMRRYKQVPCIVARHQAQAILEGKRLQVDIYLASGTDLMTAKEQQRLCSVVAAYTGLPYSSVQVQFVAPANSSRVRLELPQSGAEPLVAGFLARDPRLFAFLAEVGGAEGVLRIEAAKPESPAGSTDTSEKGLETLIFTSMTAFGWIAGDPKDYDRDYAVDLVHLTAFLQQTQEAVASELQLGTDNPERRKLLARLQAEINSRGVIDVLRHGIKHGKHELTLFYGTPSPGNDKAAALFGANRFSVSRQLRYSRDETRRALDLCLFINGLPIATFELKNSLTKQTVEDAVEQYRRDRDPRELLFKFGRSIVHFAMDDQQVKMCTELKGKASWFLPFDQGWNDGAGNPPNPYGIQTDYLWKRILTPRGLTDIIENYAEIIEETNPKTGKTKDKQVFPRYQQLDVVRRLLADVAWHGPGKRYLIQHSAGSGKSNSIAWLAHQLIRVRKDGKEVFDSIIVITDRRILDQQIQATIKDFAQVSATVGHATHSGDLRRFIEGGKKIIISTVQMFPFILGEIGDQHRTRNFAIIIDEAHSSQGGKTSAAVSEALADPEDEINDALEQRMAARRLLDNASYFAFTATPKNKTLEMFGDPFPGEEGKTRHKPFHSYTMKQAIQEGFILDVLKSYTPVDSYYKLVKTVESDPEFDIKRAQKKLRRYVESHDHAIRLKAEIMVDHFQGNVIALNKIGGQARAMVVTSGIERAIQYFHAFREYLQERKSPYRAIVAFSGEHEYGGAKVTEASLNGFPSSEIADRIQEDPYRFLICADKFQTGYDEPLLHTMYVDKLLAGVKAVQTLSRLNRAHPQKHDVFVLDFMNNTETITAAFSDYYRTTVLSEETDPNKLHDLKAALDSYQVYSPEQVEALVRLYLEGADRQKYLDPILDTCVAVYKERLNEDGQVDFKGKAKAFTRTYDFLASILPYNNAAWEKLSIVLTFLVPKLPAPIEEDLSKGILEAIDMDSYRAEKKAAMKISVPDADAEIGPVPASGGGRKPEPELDRLSNILKTFNEHFGTLFTDADRVAQRIKDDIAPKVAADQGYRNAKMNTPETARLEHDKALQRVMVSLLKDDTELYKHFVQNESFRRFVTDMVFTLTSG
jgi:type I restriction enzyme R subunit